MTDKRSDRNLANNKVQDSVMLTPIESFSVERKETAVSTSEAMTSKLPSGVTGVAGLDAFFRREKRFLAQGTGWPQT